MPIACRSQKGVASRKRLTVLIALVRDGREEYFQNSGDFLGHLLLQMVTVCLKCLSIKRKD